MSERNANARVTRRDLRQIRRLSSSHHLRPLRRPSTAPKRPAEPQKTESGVRRKLVSTLPPAATSAPTANDVLELVELVSADMSRDPRRED